MTRPTSSSRRPRPAARNVPGQAAAGGHQHRHACHTHQHQHAATATGCGHADRNLHSHAERHRHAHRHPHTHPSRTSPRRPARAAPRAFCSIEFLPHPASGGQEFIELINLSAQAVDLGGWQLDDAEGGAKPYTLPGGTVIAAGGLAVFDQDLTGVGLNDDGDTARLLRPDGSVADEWRIIPRRRRGQAGRGFPRRRVEQPRPAHAGAT